MNTCPKCGLVKGLHGSVLPGCTCWDAYPQHAETTPPQRPWVGLTDEERKEVMRYQKDFWGVSGWEWKCMEAIEAKLKEKNNAT